MTQPLRFAVVAITKLHSLKGIAFFWLLSCFTIAPEPAEAAWKWRHLFWRPPPPRAVEVNFRLGSPEGLLLHPRIEEAFLRIRSRLLSEPKARPVLVGEHQFTAEELISPVPDYTFGL